MSLVSDLSMLINIQIEDCEQIPWILTDAAHSRPKADGFEAIKIPTMGTSTNIGSLQAV